MLVCPCLGPTKEPVGRLFIDEAGQLVWTALGANGEPRSHHTFVALQKLNNHTVQVALAQAEKLTPTLHQGVGTFHVNRKNDGSAPAVHFPRSATDEVALAGDESIGAPSRHRRPPHFPSTDVADARSICPNGHLRHRSRHHLLRGLALRPRARR